MTSVNASALDCPGEAGPSAAKVMIAVNTSWNVVNFRAGLVRGLIQRGYQVVVAAPPDDYSPQIEKLGASYVPLPMDNQGTSPTKDVMLFQRFWKIMRREKPDVFLGFTVKPNVYGALAAHSLCIPVINNISGLGTVFIRRTWLTHIVKALYRAVLGKSHVVFFQNDDDRKLFLDERLVPSDRTAMLPGSGIDISRFEPAKDVRDPTSPFRFLLIARLLWDKGVREYVEAARLVRAKAPGTKFQLLGFLDVANQTAVAREDVEAWVNDGIIEYLGTTDDVRPFIAAADCVVLPSYREGTPRSLLEAAAMAKPLIATDVPGCREVVEHAINGFLCSARDASSLAHTKLRMLHLEASERAAMGQAGRAKIEARFDESIVVARYLEAVERAVGGKRIATQTRVAPQ
jgi:glycosyltransferase involved in cell wall biosynthesis